MENVPASFQHFHQDELIVDELLLLCQLPIHQMHSLLLKSGMDK